MTEPTPTPARHADPIETEISGAGTTANQTAEPGQAGRDASDAAADLRARILVIAERLFREIGYRKTTVADIAAELRMSPGNLYRVFASKKALNEAVAERLLGQIEAELGRIAGAPGAPAADRLARFILALHRMNAGQFTAERRMHDMVEAAMAESWGIIQAHIDRIDAMLRQLVADGVRSGEFAIDDPDLAARCVHAALVRFCHPAIIAQCGEESDPSIEAMTAFLLAGLGYRRASP